MPAYSILIADAQYLVRVGLRCILSGQHDLQVIAEVGNLAELRQALALHQPDLLIVDYYQPGAFSLQGLGEVLQSYPQLKTLVISDDDNRSAIFKVLEAGVHSFLTKTCDAQEILDAVRATLRGDKFFCTKILNALLEKSLGKDNPFCTSGVLSPREVEIVQLAARGFVAKKIADMLHISPHTVYTHRKKIMKKLQLETPSELVQYAMRHGMLDNC